MKKTEVQFSDEIRLNKEDIEQLSLKTHPLQLLVRDKFNVEHTDDYFSLPQPYMRAMDAALLIYRKGEGKYGKGYATSTYKISPEDPWFWCHFLGDPVMPGSQGQDAFVQLAGCWGAFSGELYGRPRALEGTFVFNGQIFPTSGTLYFRMDVKRFLKKRRLLHFEGTLSVGHPDNVIYTFGETKLGYFTREELKIEQNSIEYYKPDWDTVRANALKSINQAEHYYKQD